jgi:hypothetical protein
MVIALSTGKPLGKETLTCGKDTFPSSTPWFRRHRQHFPPPRDDGRPLRNKKWEKGVAKRQCECVRSFRPNFLTLSDPFFFREWHGSVAGRARGSQFSEQKSSGRCGVRPAKGYIMRKNNSFVTPTAAYNFWRNRVSATARLVQPEAYNKKETTGIRKKQRSNHKHGFLAHNNDNTTSKHGHHCNSRGRSEQQRKRQHQPQRQRLPHDAVGGVETDHRRCRVGPTTAENYQWQSPQQEQ